MDISEYLISIGYKEEDVRHNRCLCPNPLHEDKKIGNFHVNVRENYAYCFACGFTVNSHTTKDIKAKEGGNLFDEKTYSNEDIKNNSKIYKFMIKFCELIDSDQKRLLSRGLSEKLIRKNGYFSFPLSKDNIIDIKNYARENNIELKNVPGFNQKGFPNQKNRCIGMPIFDYKGRILGIQLNNFMSPNKKYTWFSGWVDQDKRINIPIESKIIKVDDSEEYNLYIMEGHFKKEIFIEKTNFKRNSIVLAIPGVTHARKMISRYLDKSFLKKFDVKKIFIAFDMDVHQKDILIDLYSTVIDNLKKFDIPLYDIKWDDNFKGIDDYIMNRIKNKKQAKYEITEK